MRARNAGIAALGAARSGRPFSTPDVKLSLAAIAEQAGALIENAFAHRDKLADTARATEMLLAAQVQHDLLPRTWPELPGIRSTPRHIRPRRWAATSTTCCRSARCLFACLGDVSGKGVPAAIVMAMAHAAFRCALRTSPPEPQWLLRSAVSSLYDDFVALEMFATGFLCFTTSGRAPCAT